MSKLTGKPAFSSVKILSSEQVFDGFFNVERNTVQHPLYQGGVSQPFTRETFIRHDAVGVLLFDPHLDQVGLVEQFRIGAYIHERRHSKAAPRSPWLQELVAGLIDKDEQPEAVAKRESIEEAGVKVEALEFITRYYSSPGSSCEEFFLYCGKADLSDTGEHFGLPEENEDIRLYIYPLKEFFNRLDNGLLDNAHTIIAAQWLRANLNRLLQQWANLCGYSLR